MMMITPRATIDSWLMEIWVIALFTVQELQKVVHKAAVRGSLVSHKGIDGDWVALAAYTLVH